MLVGQQSVDADTGQVGPIIAEMLGVPQVTYADKIEAFEDYLVIDRKLENVEQTITAKLPILLTATDKANSPKYTNVVEIAKSFDKPIITWHASDLNLDEQRVGQAGSPTIVRSISKPKKVAKKNHRLSDDPVTAARELVDILKQKNILTEDK